MEQTQAVLMQNVACSRNQEYVFRCAGSGIKLKLDKCDSVGNGEEPYACCPDAEFECIECIEDPLV